MQARAVLRYNARLSSSEISRSISSLSSQITKITPSAPTLPTVPPTPSSLPILVYHHIRDTKPYPKSTWSWKMSVSPSIFSRQMQWIIDHGYTTIDLDTAAEILQGKRAGPTKPLVITFDDNNRSQYDIAFPTLRDLGLSATFYFVTNRLQNKSFILEDEVREMAQAGMSIQSHTITHATMTALSLKKLDAELLESRETLEAITGKPVRHVAYPSTAQNTTVREHAKNAGYTTGTIMDPRNATAKDDLFKLPRIMMTDDTNMQKVLP